jgi:phosphoglucan, water dikinase
VCVLVVSQNKLHRNAGPEDLVAVESLLARLEAQGGYSEAFLSEFRTFRAELRDFFNASSFRDLLQSLRPSLAPADEQVASACQTSREAFSDMREELRSLDGCSDR